MSDVRSFFAHYAERYLAQDAAAIAALYEAPFLAVREGEAIHLPTLSEIREHLASLMDAYARAGAATARVARLDEHQLGAYSSLVTVNWRVLDHAGSLVRDFHTTYHLLRRGDEWRILSYTNHDG